MTTQKQHDASRGSSTFDTRGGTSYFSFSLSLSSGHSLVDKARALVWVMLFALRAHTCAVNKAAQVGVKQAG